MSWLGSVVLSAAVAALLASVNAAPAGESYGIGRTERR
jgi:hypothetical protein